ncbi:low affinity immunoglobulin epsilon Fc receptor [Erinaceus europaeus]|uniref:low affinity immunoglobulin epsilon Fc receptor n=1 Tax=Erinaceus europaeus TaxID=9365 RepID=UPI0028FC87BD|nr:low affinity immunoglobulin epsilon Fc receptor [Erinaceus europaeus]
MKNPQNESDNRGPGPTVEPQEVPDELPRRWQQSGRSCRQGMLLALLGLVTAALWAGLLTLMLHWHWDSEQNLKKLEEMSAKNVSQVTQDMERHWGSQTAQKSRADQISQHLEKLQAEQKKMQSQDSSLFENLVALQENVINFKSLSLNKRRQTQDSVTRLWEEVARLWMELRVANARTPRVTPGETPAAPTQPEAPAAPTTVPTSEPSSVPTTVPSTVPTTNVPSPEPTTVPTTSEPSPESTTMPSTVPTTSMPSSEPSPGPTTAALLSLSSTPGSLCNTCPQQWANFQRKCYYFGQGSKKWIQARQACRQLQGQLVSIHSQAEQDFLTKRASRTGSWIGLRDLDVEGDFIWMDEQPLNYSNWRPGEPNNASPGEHCVMMQGSGQWNDASCRSLLAGWVCDRLATC